MISLALLTPEIGCILKEKDFSFGGLVAKVNRRGMVGETQRIRFLCLPTRWWSQARANRQGFAEARAGPGQYTGRRCTSKAGVSDPWGLAFGPSSRLGASAGKSTAQEPDLSRAAVPATPASAGK